MHEIGTVGRLSRRLFGKLVAINAKVPGLPVSAMDPETAVVWVSPLSITRCLSTTVTLAYQRAHGFDFKYYSDGSRVFNLKLNGYWDKFLEDAATIPEWRGLEERFGEGRPWRDTAYYRLVKSREGEAAVPAWLAKMEAWDRIFEDMRTNGYRRQNQVRPENRVEGWATEGSPLNEIQVVVTRSGEFVRVKGGGKHRFMMARILKIPKIPVVVNVWHPRAEARLAELRGEPLGTAAAPARHW